MALAEAGRRSAAPVEPFEQVEFTRSHQRGLVGFRVVVAEHVQDPVDDQQRQLVVERAGVLGELAGGDRTG